MIKRQSHSTVYVIDQQEALEFYRDKLGFEVQTDLPMNDEGSVRWLTVSPKGQGVEFVSPLKEQFYGTEAIVKDNSGNWFSLAQRKA